MTPTPASAPYRGRFAPSPTGPLHAGSLAAALASWLDARAHSGRWLVRIEDVDTPRCVPGADEQILRQLAALGLSPDEPPPVRQSERTAHYLAALERLVASEWAYPCGCTRSEIAHALAERGVARERHGELPYPGTCRGGLHGKPARAMRLLVAASTADRAPPGRRLAASAPRGGQGHSGRPGVALDDRALHIDWHDRRLGAQHQDVTHAVGDFILERADGLWAYQLAVVVDDAEQGITHVVRGEDLADNTPRQIHLQRVLGLPTPTYLHTPLVLGADGEKLSKRNAAVPIDTNAPLATLREAGLALGLNVEAADLGSWLACAVEEWAQRWCQDS